MAKQMYSSGTVARRLQLPRWRLLYLLDRGDLPAPSHLIPGRRLFTEDDVDRISKALQQRPQLRRAGAGPDRNSTASHE